MKYKDWVELSSEVGQLISQGARAYKEIKINIEHEWVQLIDVTLDNTQSQFPPMDKFLFLSFVSLLSFMFLFHQTHAGPSLQPSCLYPRCCHVSSYPTRTWVPLWTRRLFPLTVCWLTQIPTRGSSSASQISWWDYEGIWWRNLCDNNNSFSSFLSSFFLCFY